jgi:hypothetical protein
MKWNYFHLDISKSMVPSSRNWKSMRLFRRSLRADLLTIGGTKSKLWSNLELIRRRRLIEILLKRTGSKEKIFKVTLSGLII